MASTHSTPAPVPVATTLSNVVFFLTVPLEYSAAADEGTLARLRGALKTHFEEHFALRRGELLLELAAGVMPPRPLLAACHAVRMRWSDWFAALSPSGIPIMLAVRDDRDDQLLRCAADDKTFVTTIGPALRRRSSSIGRSSSCSSMRSDVPSLVSSSSLSASDSCPSPPQPAFPALPTILDQDAPARRPRRQRGGVKQKQRGIHIDKSRLDVTPYDGGVTGVLTGGVMLGRRVRPVAVL